LKSCSTLKSDRLEKRRRAGGVETVDDAPAVARHAKTGLRRPAGVETTPGEWCRFERREVGVDGEPGRRRKPTAKSRAERILFTFEELAELRTKALTVELAGQNRRTPLAV
jgi:hypothetical protein